jgi:hypothetical protein
VLAEWRHEVKVMLNGKIDDKDLVCFTYQKGEFDPSSNEFERDGKRYDVVRTEEKGSSLIIYCWADDEETALVQIYRDALFQNTDINNNLHKKLNRVFNSLLTDYTLVGSLSLVVGRKVDILTNHQRPTTNDFTFPDAQFFDIPSPPPKFI